MCAQDWANVGRPALLCCGFLVRRLDVQPMSEFPITPEDWRSAAREKMESSAFDYYASGADSETTVVENIRAWGRHQLHPKVLAGVDQIDTHVEVLGERFSSPVMIAPTAYHKLADPEGECATARAAALAQTVMVVSTLGTTTLERIAQAAPSGKRWFQLYVHRDRELTESLIDRAEAAGYTAIVLTADTPLLGRRLKDEANSFTLPDGLKMENLAVAVPSTNGSGLAEYAASQLDASLTFEALEWLCKRTSLPVVVKGVLRADDALRCVSAGARAIIVSNHGGRQLDHAVATADALAVVRDAVPTDIDVLVDGGIRTGTDVVKAVALGASAVLIGRSVLWGLAVHGEKGVGAVLAQMQTELALALALVGAPSVAGLDRSFVSLRPS